MFCVKLNLAPIGIYPFVFFPEYILKALFEFKGKEKGLIPLIDQAVDRVLKQELMKFQRYWRHDFTTCIVENYPFDIGEEITFALAYEHEEPAHKSISY